MTSSPGDKDVDGVDRRNTESFDWAGDPYGKDKAALSKKLTAGEDPWVGRSHVPASQPGPQVRRPTL